MRRWTTSLLLGLLLTSVARADVIHLRHGGRIEGDVLERDEQALTVRVKHGGKLVIPLDAVRRVETRASALEEYADRLTQVDMQDPASIERLGLWCSSRGLGEKAQELTGMAQGLRLERMVARARARGSAQAFVDIFYWARSVGLADEVLLWVLDQGSALDPGDTSLRGAYAKLREDLDDRVRRAAYLEELRRRPRYLMPGRTEQVVTAPTAEELRERHAEERARRRTSGADPQGTRDFLEEARAARVLEAERRAGILQRRQALERAEAERRAAAERARLEAEDAARLSRERRAEAGD